MLDIKKIDSIEQLRRLKQQYIEQVTAPLDGMWLTGFVPIANHFGFYKNEMLIGFCCVNQDGYLLQFYVDPGNQIQAASLFELIINKNDLAMGKVNGAFVSTAEAQYLSHCLDNFTSFKVNSLMYQQGDTVTLVHESELEMVSITLDQLSVVVEFAKTNMGAPEEWLTGYFSNLFKRKELYGYWQNNQLVATGEFRMNDKYQIEYVDLGMIVATSERGKGIATNVLKFLINIAQSKGLKPICSTEKDNIGAQKAISRAGLISGNRIVQFDV
jgi:GNAT superfamily N-acetyltransferase